MEELILEQEQTANSDVGLHRRQQTTETKLIENTKDQDVVEKSLMGVGSLRSYPGPAKTGEGDRYEKPRFHISASQPLGGCRKCQSNTF